MNQLLDKKPLACRKCELYKNCKTWNHLPRVVMAKDNKQYPPILVIGGYPNSTEDASGLSFTGKEWDFLDKTLSLLEAPYVLAHALRCHPYDPSTDTHGSKAHDHEQVKLCSNQFLAPLIEKYKPQVIVCLGSQAVAAVFGTDQVDPPSIGLFRHKVAEIDGVQVLTSLSPLFDVRVSPWMKDNQDLKQEYFDLFALAESITMGRIEKHPLRHKVYEDPKEVEREVFPQLRKVSEVVFDAEWAVNPNNPERATIHHKGARVLNVSFTIKNAADQYKTFVLHGRTLNPTTLSVFFKGKGAIAHQLKGDVCALRKLGVRVYKLAKWTFDTMLARASVDLGVFGNGLKERAYKLFGAKPWAIWKDLLVKILAERKDQNKAIKKENKSLLKLGLPLNTLVSENVDLEDVYNEYPDKLFEYGAYDTHWTARIFFEASPKDVKKLHPDLMPFLMDVSEVLEWVEDNGVPIDLQKLEATEVVIQKKIKKLRRILLKQPEVKEALSKTKDGEFKTSGYFPGYLADATGVKDLIHERTDSGAISYAKEVKWRLGGINPEIPHGEKTRSQWIWYYFWHITAWESIINTKFKEFKRIYVDGKIRTSFIVAKTEKTDVSNTGADDLEGGTVTGRTSSKPNFQNWGSRGTGKLLKSCMVAPKGWTFAEADFAGIELVFLAYLSRDERMCQTIRDGIKLHAVSARSIFKLRDDQEPTRFQYDIGKRGNFAKVYGESEETFAERNSISLKQSRRIFRAFDRTFPGVNKAIRASARKLRANSLCETLFHRRRHFHLVGKKGKDAKIERERFNYEIQSAASDLTLTALIRFYRWLQKTGMIKHCKVINVVHDSIWCMIRKPYVERILAKLKQIMEDRSRLPFDMDLPLTVEMETGDCLARKEEYKVVTPRTGVMRSGLRGPRGQERKGSKLVKRGIRV